MISIVVATLNSAETLTRCLESVMAQDYPTRELVVIDGASSDGTVDVIRAHQRAISYWESKPDRGVYHAWNKGLERTHGEWLYFLGADDWLNSSQVLSLAAERLRDSPDGIRIAYGRVALVSPAGQVVELLGEPWETARPRLKKRLSIHTPGVFFRRSVFDIHGRFDESFHIAGDYEFLLRELTVGSPLFLDDIVVCSWSLGGLSSDPNSGPLLKFEDARARRMHGLAPCPPVWWWELGKSYVARALYRRLGPRQAAKIRNLYRRVAGKHPRPEIGPANK